MTRRQKERLMFRMTIGLAVAVLLLLSAGFISGLVRKIRWNDMLMDLAYSTAAVGETEDLCAVHGDEKVRVCFGNARRVHSFLQNGGLGKNRLFAPKDGDRIFLDYGNGTTLTLIDLGEDLVYMVYESPRMRLSTQLGYMTQFSKLEILVSAEGGSESNSLWE